MRNFILHFGAQIWQKRNNYVDKKPESGSRFFLVLKYTNVIQIALRHFFLKIWPWVKNKYVLTISVFTIWMFFFDQNNVVDRMKMTSEIRQLEADREYFQEAIIRDSTRLHELTTNRDNLEKFAREQYLMKKKNEDVFVIVEENSGR